MKKRHLIVCISVMLIFIGLSGCVTKKMDIIIDDNYYQNAPRDPFVFNNVFLNSNFLFVNVSYGGGCKDHIFNLIATSFMESYPVQVNIVLSHEDNDDPCDAWITEEMIFNLLPLKKSYQHQYSELSGIIILNLNNWDESIRYEF
jgi:hypothetical protein